MKVKVKLKGGIIMDTVITGRFISELRKEKGLTQAELAEKLNVTDKAVSKWERDLSCPDVSSLSKLAETLGISLDELMSGKSISSKKLDMVELVCTAVSFAMGIAVIILFILSFFSNEPAMFTLLIFFLNSQSLFYSSLYIVSFLNYQD